MHQTVKHVKIFDRFEIFGLVEGLDHLRDIALKIDGD